ncbi:hypothetical protein GW17_00020148 [Ensete ventricosum]|nr:hypothetical protein GW17_00020148 [Ensete ventricosum]
MSIVLKTCLSANISLVVPETCLSAIISPIVPEWPSTIINPIVPEMCLSVVFSSIAPETRFSTVFRSVVPNAHPSAIVDSVENDIHPSVTINCNIPHQCPLATARWRVRAGAGIDQCAAPPTTAEPKLLSSSLLQNFSPFDKEADRRKEQSSHFERGLPPRAVTIPSDVTHHDPPVLYKKPLVSAVLQRSRGPTSPRPILVRPPRVSRRPGFLLFLSIYMDSNPSEDEAGRGSLDLNCVAIASEQPETLTSAVALGSDALGVECVSDGGAMDDAAVVGDADVIGQQLNAVDADPGESIEVVGGGLIDAGSVKVVTEAGTPGAETNIVDKKDAEGKGDGAMADVGEMKVDVEAGIRHADAGVADAKLVDNIDIGMEMSSPGDEDVKVSEEEMAARKKWGRPQKSIDKGDAISPVVDLNVSAVTGSCEDQDVPLSDQKSTARRKRRRPRPSIVELIEHAGCLFPFQDEKKAVFAGSDLVWGKVRSHPWWPGQIFYPCDASKMALNIQKKDHHLVAFFGDKTFAWCDESRLKHFGTYFSQLENQSSSNAFVTGVGAALQEVSRRVEMGMTCHCFMDEIYASLEDQKIENAGIQEGTCGSTVDRSCIGTSFEPLRLVDYIQTLAQFPHGWVDNLELVVVKSQLKAFYHSMGYAELPVFVIVEELEDDIEGSPSMERISGEDIGDPSTPTSSDAVSGNRKSRVRGSSHGEEKHIFVHGRKKKSLSELLQKNSDHHDADKNTRYGGKASSHKNDKGADFDLADSGKGKKKKLDSLVDLGTKSQTSKRGKLLKVGECMHQVAEQMTGSTPMLKSTGNALTKSSTKASGRKDGFGDASKQKKTRRGIKSVPRDYSSPGEMLAELCVAACDPTEEYNSVSVMLSFFTEFRSRVFCSSGKRGTIKSTDIKSASLETVSDHVQESHWSDVVVTEGEEVVSTEQKREVELQGKLQKKQQPVDELAPHLALNSISDVGQHLQDDSANPNYMRIADGEKRNGQIFDGTNPNNMQ